MEEFGSVLRRLRTDAGLRQQDLVDALGGVVARSTLSNIEHGRQVPPQAMMSALGSVHADWLPELQPLFEDLVMEESEPQVPKEWPFAGPFALERAIYTYNFRDHAAPEEIFQFRTVRALADGVDRYALLQINDGTEFEMETECIWGGVVTRQEKIQGGGRIGYAEDLVFPKRLRKDDIHEFCVRTWVNRVDFDDSILLNISMATKTVTLRLNYFGEHRPNRIWSFGPLLDTSMAPRDRPAPGDHELDVEGREFIEVTYSRPIEGRLYGLAWS